MNGVQQPYQSPYVNNQNMNKGPNKSGKILILIIVIALLICCGGIGAFISFMVGIAKPKEMLSVGEFELAMQDLHFTAYSGNTDNYSEFHTDDYKSEVTYEVLMSHESAIAAGEVYDEVYKTGVVTSSSTTSGSNYILSSWKASNTYYCYFIVDNTIIWIYTPDKEFMNEIRDKLNI